LYGQLYDGTEAADGATVSIYPLDDDTDVITDTVGEGGNSGLSGHWKVNLYNLITDLNQDDIVAIYGSDGDKETITYYTVNLNEGTHYFELNLDASFNDYDEDGYMGDEDCDDNDDTIYPGAEDGLGDGIDQDCSGFDGTGMTESLEISQGWTLFSLVYDPNMNSEELGKAIVDSGIDCSVIMTFNENTQLMEDDIINFGDPSFSLTGTDAYFIHCSEAGNFDYQGLPWT
jgi:hypothetical protein